MGLISVPWRDCHHVPSSPAVEERSETRAAPFPNPTLTLRLAHVVAHGSTTASTAIRPSRSPPFPARGSSPPVSPHPPIDRLIDEGCSQASPLCSVTPPTCGLGVGSPSASPLPPLAGRLACGRFPFEQSTSAPRVPLVKAFPGAALGRGVLSAPRSDKAVGAGFDCVGGISSHRVRGQTQARSKTAKISPHAAS